MSTDNGSETRNFLEQIIEDDLRTGRVKKVATRFPPEPNGYLHIGHAKSICLNFGLARKYKGTCNLRFDDTNPTTEEVEYVESIKEDVRWLGFDWEGREYYASDYFEKLHDWAVKMIRDGNAYVDSQSEEEIASSRGNFYKKGTESPFRNRTVEENLDLFARMRAGEFPAGSHVLRARIDMQSGNMNLRDPIMYRIVHASHHRTRDRFCIYPMYDWAHGQSDAIEGITHSICTLEFENHRALYDWFAKATGVEDPPHQHEFARLNLTYTVMSKRILLRLVKDGLVTGWDDPRMPTISGMRRRGYPPEAIRRFCDQIGVAKNESMVDVALLEHCVRERLNEMAPRYMGVLRPLRLVIENMPDDHEEMLKCPLHPEDPSLGFRMVPFSRVVYVEREDFREDPPKKWHRLAPGKEVRLRYACLVTVKDVIKDSRGEVVEIRCTWDPLSAGGNAPDGRKVRGTLHWVSAGNFVDADVRLYDRLFTRENPLDLAEGESFTDFLNPASMERIDGCKLEPALARVTGHVQLERLGYFIVDPIDSGPGRPVLNRTVSLRDSWAKIEKAMDME